MTTAVMVAVDDLGSLAAVALEVDDEYNKDDGNRKVR
jgi:hypothetical protein